MSQGLFMEPREKISEMLSNGSLDLKMLKAFFLVSVAGSYTEASKKNSITQSTLSYRVGALERSLQTKLLNRLRRGVSLTPDGENVFEEAKSIFEKISPEGRV